MPKKDLDLSFLTQNYEEIELPSRGLLYNKEIKNGKVHIRPWISTEEKLIDKFNRGNFYDIIKRLIQNSLEEKISIEDLTVGDMFYILNWIRSISYGSTYNIKRSCPLCDEQISVEVNLYDYEIKYLSDINEPLDITLPKSGIQLKMRLPRVKELIESTEKTHSDTKKFGVSISSEIYKFAKCTLEMVLPNDEKTILNHEEDFDTMLYKVWPKIQGIDLVKIRSELDKYDHGYVDNLEVRCKECGRTFEQAPLLTYEFFRPSN